MARPWRIEYEGALYHVFSRGNNRQDIFVTDDDRRMFLDSSFPKYSAENSSILEDIRHGFIYGSQKFVKKIKDRYMTGEPDPAIPQQKSILKDPDPVAFSNRAARILRCDLERIKNAPRVSQCDKIKRDILFYLLWKQGSYSNNQIGAIVGLTYSAVSRRIGISQKKPALEGDFARQVKAIKSLIKP